MRVCTENMLWLTWVMTCVGLFCNLFFFTLDILNQTHEAFLNTEGLQFVTVVKQYIHGVSFQSRHSLRKYPTNLT